MKLPFEGLDYWIIGAIVVSVVILLILAAGCTMVRITTPNCVPGMRIDFGVVLIESCDPVTKPTSELERANSPA